MENQATAEKTGMASPANHPSGLTGSRIMPAIAVMLATTIKVVFRYEPESVRLGAWISLGACVIWLAGFLLARVWLTLPSEPQEIEGGEEPSAG